MTWVSHILVGASAAKLTGFDYRLAAFGAVLPDLLEYLLPTKHRGISHSLTIWSIVSVAGFLTGIQALQSILLGVLIGHLLMDSLTITGVPLYDEKGRYITVFGGRLRTGSAIEFVIAGLAAVFAFVIMNSPLELNHNRYKTLYEKGIIDRREYEERRFKVF